MLNCAAFSHRVQLREKEGYNKNMKTGGLSGGKYVCVNLSVFGWLDVQIEKTSCKDQEMETTMSRNYACKPVRAEFPCVFSGTHSPE